MKIITLNFAKAFLSRIQQLKDEDVIESRSSFIRGVVSEFIEHCEKIYADLSETLGEQVGGMQVNTTNFTNQQIKDIDKIVEGYTFFCSRSEFVRASMLWYFFKEAENLLEEEEIEFIEDFEPKVPVREPIPADILTAAQAINHAWRGQH